MSPSSDMKAFKEIVSKSKYIVVLTGAGVSAESGVPTFRGAGGFWRKYQAQNLASPIAFNRDPGLVWEFYHYRRELVFQKKPNNAHFAIADFEKRCTQEGKKLVLITQNVDELHKTAGSKDIIELHGSLFKTVCLKCDKKEDNYNSPICEGLRGKGAPEPNAVESLIEEKDLPKCSEVNCGGLLRPDIVWFGESLKSEVLAKAEDAMDKCDLCLVVGTSSVVYPAAMFAPQAASRGVPVAEFNLEKTSCTDGFSFHFEGPCGETIPKALGPEG